MPRGDADKDGKGSPAPTKFSDNERVLCFHGPLIYEGKVLKHEFKEADREYAYWIHYAGWSKNWDEWVLERRVLKYSEQNMEKQRDLKAAHDESIRAAKMKASGKAVNKKRSLGSDTSSVNMSTTDSRSSTPVMDPKSSKIKGSAKSEPPESESAKRRKRSEFVETETHYVLKQEVDITVPDQFKIFLVDDWDTVVRQKRLVNLPVKYTIEQIFNEYENQSIKKPNEFGAVDLCGGLRKYFNTMVGSQLLYRFERSQYEQIVKELANQSEKDKKDLTDYYGAPHLMRLFTKLGGCLTYTSLDTIAVDLLRKSTEDFMKFLVKNYEKYFSLEDYGVSCPEYQRKPT